MTQEGNMMSKFWVSDGHVIFELPNNEAFVKGFLTFVHLNNDRYSYEFSFSPSIMSLKDNLNLSKHVLISKNELDNLYVNGKLLNLSLEDNAKSTYRYTSYKYVAFFDMKDVIPNRMYHKNRYILLGSSTLSFMNGFATGIMRFFGSKNCNIQPLMLKNNKLYVPRLLYSTIHNRRAKIIRDDPKIKSPYIKCCVCHNYHYCIENCRFCDMKANVRCNVRFLCTNKYLSDKSQYRQRLRSPKTITKYERNEDNDIEGDSLTLSSPTPITNNSVNIYQMPERIRYGDIGTKDFPVYVVPNFSTIRLNQVLAKIHRTSK